MEEDKTIKHKPATKSLSITIPEDFQRILKKKKHAAEHFEKLSPSKKKEYIDLITETTRTKRIETSIQ